jgi:hypothetical protein
MKSLALLLLAASAAACAARTPSVAVPSPVVPARAQAEGATMAQPSDSSTRLLGKDECESLGEWIAEGCRGASRSAQSEAWCSEMHARTGSGTWVDDCTAHVRTIDAACFEASANPGSMMSCDRTIER